MALFEGRLNNQIYEHVRKEILEGKFKPGEELLINDLSKELNVSNTPIREALKELNNIGLLEKSPYKSYRVKKFSFDEIKNIYETRIALESYAGKLASERINAEEISKLKKLHKEGIEFYENNDLVNFRDYNDKFHMTLIRSTKNSYLKDMYNNICQQIILFSNKVFSETNRAKQTIREHEKILEAVTNKESKCSKLIEEHIKNSWRKHKKIIKAVNE